MKQVLEGQLARNDQGFGDGGHNMVRKDVLRQLFVGSLNRQVHNLLLIVIGFNSTRIYIDTEKKRIPVT